MILKSALKSTIDEVLEEHEVEDDGLASDLLDRLVQDFGDEVHDDDDDPGFLGGDSVEE
jgi:hypothetical protein